MAEDTSKIPVTTDKAAPSESRSRRPLESLRQEIDRLFDDFERWSRFAGQAGGLAKVDSGLDYAANFSSFACVA